MSSPLSWFRKNQKLLLGVFGVMLMIVFTLTAGSVGVDQLLGLMPGGDGSSGSSQREVAASWSGGTLYETDLQFLRFNRARLVAFMQGALRTAFERGGRPTVPGIPLGDSDQALVETRLLAERARDMGLVVNDDAVLEYLLAFTGNVVDRSQLVAILRSSSGRPLTQDQLFEVLREELLAQKIRLMAQTGVFPRSPAAAWDYYSRLNRQVKAELMPIEVSEFINEIPDPSDEELKAFFEKHKDQYAVPYSPEPGFKRRQQMDFQFVRADFDKFLGAELANVTDQEIEDHYQTHRDDYRETFTPGASDLDINPARLELGADGPSAPGDAASGEPQDSSDATPDSTEVEDEDVLQPESPSLEPESPSLEPESPSLVPESPSLEPEAAAEEDDLSLFSVSSQDASADESGSDVAETSADDASQGEATDDTEPEDEATGDVESEDEATGDVESEDEATGDAEPEDEATGDVESEDEATGDAEPDDEATGDAEPDDEATGDTEPDDEATGDTEPEDEALGDTEPDDEATGDVESEDETVDEAVDETVDETDVSEAKTTDENTEATAHDPELESGGDGASGQADQPAEPVDDGSSADADESGITASDLDLDPNRITEPADTAEQNGDVTEPSSDLASPTTVDGAAKPETENADTGAVDQTPVYRPLEEVREQIQRDIAIPRAQAKMDESLSASRTETERFYKSSLVWQLTPEGERDPAKMPTPPDFTALTAKYGGLTIDSTGMVDQISIQDHELGQLSEPSYSGASISFASIAFGEDVDAYKARVFPQQGFGDVKFLFWKVDEKDAFVPKLDDQRAEVISAWKKHEDRAVRLAVEAGQQIAQRVRDSGQTLAEAIANEPGRRVLRTEEVSWMTTGSLSVNTGGQVYLSPIPEVEGAGHTFRETMFRLHPGQVGVAVNQPQTIVYVIRLVSETPDQDILRERFFASNASSLISRGQSNPVGYLAGNESNRVLSQWYLGMLQEMGFEWARDPQGPTTRSE